MFVRGLERRAHRYFDLGLADLFPLVEQPPERGMHLLDGLVLEKGHRVMPLLIRSVDDLDTHMGFHGCTAYASLSPFCSWSTLVAY